MSTGPVFVEETMVYLSSLPQFLLQWALFCLLAGSMVRPSHVSPMELRSEYDYVVAHRNVEGGRPRHVCGAAQCVSQRMEPAAAGWTSVGPPQTSLRHASRREGCGVAFRLLALSLGLLAMGVALAQRWYADRRLRATVRVLETPRPRDPYRGASPR